MCVGVQSPWVLTPTTLGSGIVASSSATHPGFVPTSHPRTHAPTHPSTHPPTQPPTQDSLRTDWVSHCSWPWLLTS